MLCRDSCLPISASPVMGFQVWPGPALLLLSSKQEEALLAPSVTSSSFQNFLPSPGRKGVHSDCCCCFPDVTVQLAIIPFGGDVLGTCFETLLATLQKAWTRWVHLAVSASAAFSQIQKVVSACATLLSWTLPWPGP